MRCRSRATRWPRSARAITWRRKGPILIEIFPRHDDFAVRNVGLPGMIGALGACFGRVVTLDSPRARPPGTFNWQATLWHELAHVITLQLSGNRIPRWLTEGISVYEEQRARPAWSRDMDLEFAEALERDAALHLSTLNAGFMDPSTISMAYYEASLLVEFLVHTYGQPALESLVRGYADGSDTDTAMKKAMGTTLEGVEPAFYAWLHERFDPIIAAREVPDGVVLAGTVPTDTLEKIAGDHPGYYDAQLRLGDAHAPRPGTPMAPTARGNAPPSCCRWPRATRARARGLRSWRRREATALARSRRSRRTLAREGANVDAARQLAALLDGAGDHARAAKAWARVAEIDPFDATASAILGRQALDSRDAESAARWFRAALAAGPSDRAAAHCDLAESYLATGAGAAGEAPGARGARGRADLRARAGPAARHRGREPLMRRLAAVVLALVAVAVADRREPPRVGPGAGIGVPRRRQQREARSHGWPGSSGASCA